MKPVIIAIHGLRNKPSKYVLTDWWKKSIIEGFKVINLPVPQFTFEMAYWAQFMHEKPQTFDVTDQESPVFLWEPYIPGTLFGPRKRLAFKQKLSDSIHEQILQLFAGESGLMNINALENAILHRMFVELDIYYHRKLRTPDGKTRPAKDLIREQLAALIRKHKERNILILAHSMGSIIAYDVLQHSVPEIPIHTLITFGSPLGFPVVRKKVRQELGDCTVDENVLPTPQCITHRWLNCSDLDDETCLDYNLRNHYIENSRGVRPFDRIVYNNYEHNGFKNPHKSYGYLRTMEITQALHRFLVIENAGFLERLRWIFKGPPLI